MPVLRFRSFWLFPAFAIVGLILGRQAEPQQSIFKLFVLIPAGLLLWTLLEYVLHRFVFHRAASGLHMEHHRHPRDMRFVLVQPELAIVISAVLALILWAATRSLWHTTGILCGVWSGFLYYETVHYRVHFGNASSFWLTHQRRRHFQHHFQNSRTGFGLTSPLWDIVFGTRS